MLLFAMLNAFLFKAWVAKMLDVIMAIINTFSNMMKPW